ncbi:MAG: hypothetical protein ABSH00_03015 [Bryobacteraceae bacterium]|jgi:hypothetical protein
MAAAAALFAVTPRVALAQVKPDGPVKTTLCELKQEPKRFDGRTVQLRTEFFPGAEDSPTVLFDRSCSAVVAILWPDGKSARDIGDYRSLQRYLKKDRIVEATVTGVFANTAGGSGAFAFDSRLSLQRVSGVIAKPRDRSPYARGK